MTKKDVWEKALEQELDEKDVRLLYVLAQEMRFSPQDIKTISKRARLSAQETKKRLVLLRQKRIVLKDRVSILDQMRIWDGYYIVLIKAAIKPPVVGMETKFPTGWALKDYLSGLLAAQKELGLNIIRHAYILQGTEWDILVVASTTSQDELAAYLSKVARQGWITKTWSFIPATYGNHWIFDPIAAPNPKFYKTRTAKALWKVEKKKK